MFGSSKNKSDLSVKVKVLGQYTDSKAREALMKTVTSIKDVKSLNCLAENLCFEFAANFKNQEDLDWALFAIKS